MRQFRPIHMPSLSRDIVIAERLVAFYTTLTCYTASLACRHSNWSSAAGATLSNSASIASVVITKAWPMWVATEDFVVSHENITWALNLLLWPPEAINCSRWRCGHMPGSVLHTTRMSSVVIARVYTRVAIKPYWLCQLYIQSTLSPFTCCRQQRHRKKHGGRRYKSFMRLWYIVSCALNKPQSSSVVVALCSPPTLSTLRS